MKLLRETIRKLILESNNEQIFEQIMQLMLAGSNKDIEAACLLDYKNGHNIKMRSVRVQLNYEKQDEVEYPMEAVTVEFTCKEALKEWIVTSGTYSELVIEAYEQDMRWADDEDWDYKHTVVLSVIRESDLEDTLGYILQ